MEVLQDTPSLISLTSCKFALLKTGSFILVRLLGSAGTVGECRNCWGSAETGGGVQGLVGGGVQTGGECRDWWGSAGTEIE